VSGRLPRRILVVRRGDDLVVQAEAGKRGFGLTPAEAADVIGQLVRLLTAEELERFGRQLASAAGRGRS